MTLLSTALAALLLSQAPPPDPANEPPPGAAADRQLWRDVRDAANAGTLAMGRVNQAAYRIQYGKYYETLDGLAASAPAGVQGEARALRGRLEGAAQAAKGAVPEGGPGIRDCQYTNLDLGTRMPLASDPKQAKALAAARGEAKACVAKLAPFARTMTARAEDLEAALAACDALFARAGAVATPAAAPAPEAKP